MSVFEIFSKRQKRERGEVPDVYQYEDIPQPLRVQVVHILRDALGKSTTKIHTKSYIRSYAVNTVYSALLNPMIPTARQSSTSFSAQQT